MSTAVRDGTLPGGLPYLAIGSGPPVVVLVGLDPTGGTTLPSGPFRSAELRPFRRLARERTVLQVRRAPGIPAGSTMADLAAQHATAFDLEFGHPVDVIGVSTGASVALQLALDRPRTVRRLVLLAGAGRLSDGGRAVQREQARLTRQGWHRRAAAVTVPFVFSSAPMRLTMRAMVSLTSRPPTPQQADDLVRTIEAEDAFDVLDVLDRVAAPTLVVGGTADAFYSPALFERTAALIPDATLSLLPGRSHASTIMSSRAIREITQFLQEPTGQPPSPAVQDDVRAGRPAADEEVDMGRRDRADLTEGQRRWAVLAVAVQLTLAAAAWSDLARRDADQVRGSKAVWAAAIAVSYVGPLAYVVRGRRGG